MDGLCGWLKSLGNIIRMGSETGCFLGNSVKDNVKVLSYVFKTKDMVTAVSRVNLRIGALGEFSF